MMLNCIYLHSCRGCPLGTLDFNQQKNLKQDKLIKQLKVSLSESTLSRTHYDFVFPIFDRYRDRADFIYQDGRLGWFTQDKQFLPINECALHTPLLTEFIKLVATHPIPIKKGSVRFRVNKANQRGLWFDFANIDIKNLLSDNSFLDYFYDNSIVIEMGQKGKRLEKIQGAYKLTDPRPEAWFETTYKNSQVPLMCLVSSFTQTNPQLNSEMIKIIKSFLGSNQFSEIIEFGSGVGNFTLFLAEMTTKMVVIENDLRNLIPLRQNLKNNHLEEKVTVFENLKHYFTSTVKTAPQLYFVNPSRSGVGGLFDQPINADYVVYVSCYLDSFSGDTVKLVNQGFKLEKITLFDQFPHSEHFEIISLFKKT